MRYPVILDLETKKSFREVNDPKDLGISCVGIYDYKTSELSSYLENELSKLFPILENASMIIGFNIVSFDLPVLSSYYPGTTTQFKTFDILDDIKRILGRRLALNDILKATLNKKKSGHGLDAINLFKEGKIDDLKSYCLDDVSLTREIFEYGVKEGKISYLGATGKLFITVDWQKYLDDKADQDISLTLPF